MLCYVKEEHDRSLENVLLLLQEKNLTVNPTKCLFAITELECCGFHISAQGISLDKDRIHAIKHMQPPSTATESRSFLELVNTIAHFLPNLAAMTETIRRITHKDCSWSWGLDQSEALKASCMTSYLVTRVWIGISGTLIQKHPDDSIRPVAYASRSLSHTEQRYSQTKREA